MSDVPFTMSPNAEAHIERVLLNVQKEPQLLARTHVCVLGHALSSSWAAEGGRGGYYPFPHIVIGWDRVGDMVTDDEYTELNLIGFRVFAHKTALELLRGKRIELEEGSGPTSTHHYLAVKNTTWRVSGAPLLGHVAELRVAAG